MQTQSLVRLSTRNGVELWRLITSGAEQFVVRTGERRARLVGSLSAAEALFAHHVQQGEHARAH